MRSMSREEFAWLAGLYEGEGTLAFQAVHTVQLRIEMTDLDVIQHCVDITGVGHIYRHKSPEGKDWKPRYTWVVAGAPELRIILNGIFEFLFARRRARVNDAFERLSHIEAPSNNRRPTSRMVV